MKRLLIPGYRQLCYGQPAKAAFVNVACTLLLLAAFTTAWLHTPVGLLLWFAAILGLSAWAFVDAGKNQPDERPPAPLIPPWMWAPIALVFVAVAFNPTRIAVYKVPTKSCLPAIMPGDRIVADRWAGAPERGAMVLFRRPDGQTWVKRLVALGGDRVEGGPGGIRVNGDPVSEVAVEAFSVVVPEGHGYVLGNNVEESRDSRDIGPIKMSTIIGRPLYVLWGGAWARTLTTIH